MDRRFLEIDGQLAVIDDRLDRLERTHTHLENL